MSRKLAALALLAVSFTMVLWSTVVLAEEKAQESREAQIKQLRGQIKELEQALERVDTDKEAAELKENLQERRKKLERLMGEGRKSQEPRGEFPEVQQAIRRANGALKELRQAVKVLKEEGGQPGKLEEFQQKIALQEDKLVELKASLEKRKADARRKKDRPRTKLMFLLVERANAENLSKIIQKFLTASGIVVADSDTNIIVIKATPNDLEIALAIIKKLDIPRRRGGREQPRRDQPRRQPEQREGTGRRERSENQDVFFGKVLEASEKSLTIETRDSKEKVTLYVPLRQKEDGTSVPYEELSVHVSRFEVGSNVRVQWRQGDVRRLIVRVSKLEE